MPTELDTLVVYSTILEHLYTPGHIGYTADAVAYYCRIAGTLSCKPSDVYKTVEVILWNLYDKGAVELSKHCGPASESMFIAVDAIGICRKYG